MVDAYRLKGLCLSAVGRLEGAVGAFRRLLSIDPTFRLSRDVSPKLAPPFFKALAMEQKPISLAHTPPKLVKSLAGHEMEVVLKDDPFGMVNGIRLVFWGEDGTENKVETSLDGPGKVLMNLPLNIKGTTISYCFEATTKSGGVLNRLGTKDKPFDLQVPGARPALVLGRPPSGTEMLSTSALATNEKLAAGAGTEPEKKSKGRPFYKTWWFWTVVGVAVAGAAAGTTIAIVNGRGSSGNHDYVVMFK
jgi:hypothetical protein